MYTYLKKADGFREESRIRKSAEYKCLLCNCCNFEIKLLFIHTWLSIGQCSKVRDRAKFYFTILYLAFFYKFILAYLLTGQPNLLQSMLPQSMTQLGTSAMNTAIPLGFWPSLFYGLSPSVAGFVFGNGSLLDQDARMTTAFDSQMCKLHILQINTYAHRTYFYMSVQIFFKSFELLN